LVAPFMATSGERFAKTTFEAREHALDLPALAEDFGRKVVMHQLAIMGRRFGIASARIDRDDRGSDAEILSTERMERFGVVRRISHHALNAQMASRLADRRLKARRVIARAKSQIYAGDQVGGVVAGGREFGVAPVVLDPTLPPQKVAADVATLQAGGINAHVRRFGCQAASVCASEDSAEKIVDAPPFSSWASAFWSVVKWGTVSSARISRKSEKSLRMETMPR
jgi:hypothetical protein